MGGYGMTGDNAEEIRELREQVNQLTQQLQEAGMIAHEANRERDEARADLSASEQHVKRLNAELDRLEKRLTVAGRPNCDEARAEVIRLEDRTVVLRVNMKAAQAERDRLAAQVAATPQAMMPTNFGTANPMARPYPFLDTLLGMQ